MGRRGLTKIGRVIYSLGRLGSTALLTIASLTSYSFYLNTLSVDPMINGVAHSLSKFLMALFGLIFGYLSDLIIWRRLGKRKPFIVFGSLLLSISFIMLYNPIVLSFKNSFIVAVYELIWLTLLGIGYSALIIPYQAWMPEITEYDERAEVSFYQNIFNFIGNVIGVGASFAIFFLVKINYIKFFQFIVVMALIEVLLYIPLLIVIKATMPPIKSPNIVREIEVVLRDRNFLLWEATKGFSSAGVAIYIAMVIDFVMNYLNFIRIEYILEGSLMVLVVVSSIPILFKLSKKIGMKKVMLYSLTILSISLITFSIIPLFAGEVAKTRLGIALLTISLIGLIGYWIFNYAITANIIDANILETGESRAGTYIGVDNINVNFFQSIGYLLLGLSLKYLIALSDLAWAVVAGILTLLSVIPLKYIELDK